jgi:hypothetical protein
MIHELRVTAFAVAWVTAARASSANRATT